MTGTPSKNASNITFGHASKSDVMMRADDVLSVGIGLASGPK
jgi:hypothetical protein